MKNKKKHERRRKMEKEAREQESRITDRVTRKGRERTEEKRHDQGESTAARRA